MNDNKYIIRCLELAAKGLGHTAPNPMVGCVIVHDNKIIGESYHHEYGGPHAEVNAINTVKNKKLLKDSVLYVNLEPCSHYGKTPPCADLIIKMKVPKVVIGSEDPNSIVKGNGIRRLRAAGIRVKTGVCEKQCMELNKRFFTFHQKKRPYIILKWAMTKDGFIDVIRKENRQAQISWITGQKARTLVHQWRSEEQAVMAGTNTVINDDPQLTTRYWEGKDPVRIIIDRKLRIPQTAHVLDGSAKTIVYTAVKRKSTGNAEYVSIDFFKNIIRQVCDELFLRNIQSVIIEGGAKLLQSFIDCGKWDEARVFTGDAEFGDGLKAPVLKAKAQHDVSIGMDILRIYKNPGIKS